MAWSPEPHSRLTVWPATSTGSPASSAAIRATLRLSSPAWFAHPSTTSSINAGSMPVLSTTARMTSAARSSGRTGASAPPYRPIGVRTASTIHACRSGRSRSRAMTRLWHAALMGTRGSAEWERDLVLVGPVEPAGPPGRPAAMPTAAFDTTRRAVRRVRLGSAVLVVLAASLVAGCSAPGRASRDTTGGSAGASTSAAGGAAANLSDADAIAHPTGPTDIVLRVGDEGGFMMMEAVMSRVPRFTLYGDGRALIAQDATTAKGQAGINGAPGQVLTETRLTEAQVQDLLRFALV